MKKSKPVSLSSEERCYLISVIDQIRENLGTGTNSDIILKYVLEKLYRHTDHSQRIHVDKLFLKDYNKP